MLARWLLPGLHASFLGHVKRGTPSVIKLQTFRSSPLDRLTSLVAALGHHLTYLLLIPFMFWNVDEALARRCMVLWGIGYFLTAVTKDMLLLPRPHQMYDSVVNVHKAPLEFGLPCLRTFSAAAVPAYILVGAAPSDPFYSVVAACFAVAWWAAIAGARMYGGVHTPAGVVVGGLFGYFAVGAWLALGPVIDRGLVQHGILAVVQPLLFFLLLFAYPAPYRLTPTFAACASVIGATSGFLLGSSWLATALLPAPAPSAATLACRHGSHSCVWSTLLRGLIGTVVMLLARAAARRLVRPLKLNVAWFVPRFGSHLLVLAKAVHVFDQSVYQCLPTPARNVLVAPEPIDTILWPAHDTAAVRPRKDKRGARSTSGKQGSGAGAGAGAGAGQAGRHTGKDGAEVPAAQDTGVVARMWASLAAYAPAGLRPFFLAQNGATALPKLLAAARKHGLVGMPLSYAKSNGEALQYATVVPEAFACHLIMGLVATLLAPQAMAVVGL